MKILLKPAAAFLAVSLIITSVGDYAPSVYAAAVPETSIQIPSQLGRVEEYYHAQGRKGQSLKEAGTVPAPSLAVPKTIFYIQDAHDSLEAQEHIAKLINYLVRHQGVKTVYEEGYEGSVPTERFFGGIQNAKIREKMAYFLMDKLRIGGAEYAHITRGLEETEIQPAVHDALSTMHYPRSMVHDFKLIGADNIRLHLKNIAAYREFSKDQEQIRKDLEAISRELNLLAQQKFPKKFKSWLKVRERHDAGQLGLSEYVQRTFEVIRRQASVARGENLCEQFPNLSLLMDLVQAQATPNKKTKIGAAIQKGLDPKALFSEINALENAVADRYLKTREDLQILDYQKQIRLLKRLMEMRVTPAEYQEVKETLRTIHTQAIADFVARQAHKPVLLSRRWEAVIRNALVFYETSAARDKSISKALDDFIASPDEKNAVLVFGGFHHENIQVLLKQKNLSYYVISPKISAPDPEHEAYYKKLMTAGRHDFEIPLAIKTAARAEALFEMGFKGTAVYREALFNSVKSHTHLAHPLMVQAVSKDLMSWRPAVRSEVRMNAKGRVSAQQRKSSINSEGRTKTLALQRLIKLLEQNGRLREDPESLVLKSLNWSVIQEQTQNEVLIDITAAKTLATQWLAEGAITHLRLRSPHDEPLLYELLVKLRIPIKIALSDLFLDSSDEDWLQRALPKVQKLVGKGYEVRAIYSHELTEDPLQSSKKKKVYIYRHILETQKWIEDWGIKYGFSLPQKSMARPMIHELIFNMLDHTPGGALGLRVITEGAEQFLEIAAWDAGTGMKNPEWLRRHRNRFLMEGHGHGFEWFNIFPGKTTVESFGKKWVKEGEGQPFRDVGLSSVKMGAGTLITMRIPIESRSEMRITPAVQGSETYNELLEVWRAFDPAKKIGQNPDFDSKLLALMQERGYKPFQGPDAFQWPKSIFGASSLDAAIWELRGNRHHQNTAAGLSLARKVYSEEFGDGVEMLIADRGQGFADQDSDGIPDVLRLVQFGQSTRPQKGLGGGLSSAIAWTHEFELITNGWRWVKGRQPFKTASYMEGMPGSTSARYDRWIGTTKDLEKFESPQGTFILFRYWQKHPPYPASTLPVLDEWLTGLNSARSEVRNVFNQILRRMLDVVPEEVLDESLQFKLYSELQGAQRVRSQQFIHKHLQRDLEAAKDFPISLNAMMALHNGKPVGVYLFNKMSDEAVHGQRIFVEEALRRKGIGPRLHERALVHFKHSGFSSMHAAVSHKPEAQKFHRDMKGRSGVTLHEDPGLADPSGNPFVHSISVDLKQFKPGQARSEIREKIPGIVEEHEKLSWLEKAGFGYARIRKFEKRLYEKLGIRLFRSLPIVLRIPEVYTGAQLESSLRYVIRTAYGLEKLHLTGALFLGAFIAFGNYVFWGEGGWVFFGLRQFFNIVVLGFGYAAMMHRYHRAKATAIWEKLQKRKEPSDLRLSAAIAAEIRDNFVRPLPDGDLDAWRQSVLVNEASLIGQPSPLDGLTADTAGDWMFQRGREAVKAVQEKILYPHEESVLDIGSGAKGGFAFILALQGAHVTSFEKNPEAVKALREKYKKLEPLIRAAGGSWQVVEGDFSNPEDRAKLGARKFNHVIATDVVMTPTGRIIKPEYAPAWEPEQVQRILDGIVDVKNSEAGILLFSMPVLEPSSAAPYERALLRGLAQKNHLQGLSEQRISVPYSLGAKQGLLTVLLPSRSEVRNFLSESDMTEWMREWANLRGRSRRVFATELRRGDGGELTSLGDNQQMYQLTLFEKKKKSWRFPGDFIFYYYPAMTRVPAHTLIDYTDRSLRHDDLIDRGHQIDPKYFKLENSLLHLAKNTWFPAMRTPRQSRPESPDGMIWAMMFLLRGHGDFVLIDKHPGEVDAALILTQLGLIEPLSETQDSLFGRIRKEALNALTTLKGRIDLFARMKDLTRKNFQLLDPDKNFEIHFETDGEKIKVRLGKKWFEFTDLAELQAEVLDHLWIHTEAVGRQMDFLGRSRTTGDWRTYRVSKKDDFREYVRAINYILSGRSEVRGVQESEKNIKHKKQLEEINRLLQSLGSLHHGRFHPYNGILLRIRAAADASALQADSKPDVLDQPAAADASALQADSKPDVLNLPAAAEKGNSEEVVRGIQWFAQKANLVQFFGQGDEAVTKFIGLLRELAALPGENTEAPGRIVEALESIRVFTGPAAYAAGKKMRLLFSLGRGEKPSVKEFRIVSAWDKQKDWNRFFILTPVTDTRREELFMLKSELGVREWELAPILKGDHLVSYQRVRDFQGRKMLLSPWITGPDHWMPHPGLKPGEPWDHERHLPPNLNDFIEYLQMHYQAKGKGDQYFQAWTSLLTSAFAAMSQVIQSGYYYDDVTTLNMWVTEDASGNPIVKLGDFEGAGKLQSAELAIRRGKFSFSGYLDDLALLFFKSARKSARYTPFKRILSATYEFDFKNGADLQGWAQEVQRQIRRAVDAATRSEMRQPDQPAGRQSVRRDWTEDQIRNGFPWLEWMDQNVAGSPAQLTLPRNILFSFLRSFMIPGTSLFEDQGKEREYFGVPVEGLPNPEGLSRIVERLHQVWPAEHGDLNLWLKHATHSHNIHTYIENERRLWQLPDPLSVLLYDMRAIAIHTRRNIGHDAFMDLAVLRQQFPVFLSYLIAGLDEKIPALEGVEPRDAALALSVPKQWLYFWAVASLLDPQIYPDQDLVESREIPDYYAAMIEALQELKYPNSDRLIPVEKIITLLKNIRSIYWPAYGMAFPDEVTQELMWQWHLLVDASPFFPLGIRVFNLRQTREQMDNESASAKSAYIRGRFHNPFLWNLERQAVRMIQPKSFIAWQRNRRNLDAVIQVLETSQKARRSEMRRPVRPTGRKSVLHQSVQGEVRRADRPAARTLVPRQPARGEVRTAPVAARPSLEEWRERLENWRYPWTVPQVEALGEEVRWLVHDHPRDVLPLIEAFGHADWKALADFKTMASVLGNELKTRIQNPFAGSAGATDWESERLRLTLLLQKSNAFSGSADVDIQGLTLPVLMAAGHAQEHLVHLIDQFLKKRPLVLADQALVRANLVPILERRYRRGILVDMFLREIQGDLETAFSAEDLGGSLEAFFDEVRNEWKDKMGTPLFSAVDFKVVKTGEGPFETTAWLGGNGAAFVPFEELVKNAVTALPAASQNSSQKIGKIHAAVRRNDGNIQFVFSNTGHPAPELDPETIFLPHLSSRSSGEREKIHGTGAEPFAISGEGLGLFMARLIAELHGGSLVYDPAQDRDEQGRPITTFILTLPAAFETAGGEMDTGKILRSDLKDVSTESLTALQQRLARDIERQNDALEDKAFEDWSERFWGGNVLVLGALLTWGLQELAQALNFNPWIQVAITGSSILVMLAVFFKVYPFSSPMTLVKARLTQLQIAQIMIETELNHRQQSGEPPQSDVKDVPPSRSEVRSFGPELAEAAEGLRQQYQMDPAKAQVLAEKIETAEIVEGENGYRFIQSEGKNLVEISKLGSKRYFDFNGRWILTVDPNKNKIDELMWDTDNKFVKAWTLTAQRRGIVMSRQEQGEDVRRVLWDSDDEMAESLYVFGWMRREEGINFNQISSIPDSSFLRRPVPAVAHAVMRLVMTLASDQQQTPHYTGEHETDRLWNTLLDFAEPVWDQPELHTSSPELQGFFRDPTLIYWNPRRAEQILGDEDVVLIYDEGQLQGIETGSVFYPKRKIKIAENAENAEYRLTRTDHSEITLNTLGHILTGRSEVRVSEKDFVDTDNIRELMTLFRNQGVLRDFFSANWHATSSLALDTILKHGALMSKRALQRLGIMDWVSLENTPLNEQSVSFSLPLLTDAANLLERYGRKRDWTRQKAEQEIKRWEDYLRSPAKRGKGFDAEAQRIIQTEQARIKAWDAMPETDQAAFQQRLASQYPVQFGVVSEKGLTRAGVSVCSRK